MLRIFWRLQWVRGKALPRGNRRTPWKKAPNDCDHPPNVIQKGGNAVMYYERCEMCGNRWQRIPLTMIADEAEQSHSACVYREATGRNRTPLLSTRTGEHDDAAEPLLGMLDVQYHLRTQPGRVRCSTCRPGGASRVPTRTWFPLGTTKHRASERAGATEGCGPGGVPPIDF